MTATFECENKECTPSETPRPLLLLGLIGRWNGYNLFLLKSPKSRGAFIWWVLGRHVVPGWFLVALMQMCLPNVEDSTFGDEAKNTMLVLKEASLPNNILKVSE